MNLLPLDDHELALVADAAELAAASDPGRFGDLAQWLREEADDAAAVAEDEETGKQLRAALYGAPADDSDPEEVPCSTARARDRASWHRRKAAQGGMSEHRHMWPAEEEPW